jgi:hypothetical protein
LQEGCQEEQKHLKSGCPSNTTEHPYCKTTEQSKIKVRLPLMCKYKFDNCYLFTVK